ncbi:MAG: uracil-DNA glycosylase [Myxococcota bacterium]
MTREGFDAPGAGDPLDEARGLAASAVALLRELAEEDVVSFERLPDLPLPEPAAPSATPAPVSAAAPTPAAPPAPRIAPPVEIGGTVPWSGRRPTLGEVQTHLGDCQRCGLCEERGRIVFGDGNPQADLLFIGEGPGAEEDKSGVPFVGRAGALLTQMIEKGIGIPRSEVYICNIVKCRPPRNRTPLPPEVAACRPFLDGQIEAIRPKVIVTLGKPAASLLLDREIAITRLRGQWQDYHGIPLMPTLHPAYVLRQYTAENRRAVWEDLKAAWERVQG